MIQMLWSPPAKRHWAAGTPVVSWDSAIGKDGRTLHINQAVLHDIGAIEIKIALDLTGADGGDIAVLSATSTAPNQNAWIEVRKAELKKPEYASSSSSMSCTAMTMTPRATTKR
jgi:rhamnose transport system substrate-binding protein